MSKIGDHSGPVFSINSNTYKIVGIFFSPGPFDINEAFLTVVDLHLSNVMAIPAINFHSVADCNYSNYIISRNRRTAFGIAVKQIISFALNKYACLFS